MGLQPSWRSKSLNAALLWPHALKHGGLMTAVVVKIACAYQSDRSDQNGEPKLQSTHREGGPSQIFKPLPER